MFDDDDVEDESFVFVAVFVFDLDLLERDEEEEEEEENKKFNFPSFAKFIPCPSNATTSEQNRITFRRVTERGKVEDFATAMMKLFAAGQ